MTKFTFVCAVVAILSFVGKIEGKGKAVPAKRFKVDLDDDPMTRWNPVLENFDKSLMLDVVDTVIKKYVKNTELIAVAEIVAADLDKYLPQPYADEMRGISKFYGVKLGDVVLENLAYDITAWGSVGFKACTSIVTVDENGGIIHGRNLDYDAAEALREITTEIEFQRDGKTLFVATTYVGFIGVLTGAKPNAFSLSGDERDKGFLWENILYGLERAWPTMLMTREVLMKAEHYDEAIDMLSEAKTISPMYIIVGGVKPQEGAIIVRDRQGALNVTRMIDTSHKWFVVETNYEPWNPPPASDDRRDPAIKAMMGFGQNHMNADNLYKVLSTSPVLNDGTTYTTIMSASNISMYHTMLRFDYPSSSERSNDMVRDSFDFVF